jgi:hypothetical protein
MRAPVAPMTPMASRRLIWLVSGSVGGMRRSVPVALHEQFV